MSIDEHICVPLDSILPVQSRGKVVILLYLTNAGSSARAINQREQDPINLGPIELTVVVVARHDECVGARRGLSDGCR